MPWGGAYIQTFPQGLRQVKLVNTCPLDNFLFMMSTWYAESLSTVQRMAIETNVKDALIRSIELIKADCFADAKVAWMSVFPG